MTTMFCVYDGELRCTARHEASASRLETDAPTDNQGKGERFSPTDLVATALATCILTLMGIVARRHGWSLEGTTARVDKTMTTSGVRKIALLEVWIALPAHLDDEARTVLQEAGEGCPVKRSLEGAVPMALHWTTLPNGSDGPPAPISA
jgi:putative redox protein